VADFVGLPPERVYKTLVVLRQGPRAKPMLIMAPANRQLDLKLVAKAVGEKKVQMAAQQEAERLTGLKVGGISALALLNKGFDIYLDESARNQDAILISAGQRGVNLELAVADLVKVTRARWVEAVKPL
jgi:Cys-tRNA(Pro)/Cys-tRNA(Cys) deacylase